jgi:hypothetical protein
MSASVYWGSANLVDLRPRPEHHLHELPLGGTVFQQTVNIGGVVPLPLAMWCRRRLPSMMSGWRRSLSVIEKTISLVDPDTLRPGFDATGSWTGRSPKSCPRSPFTRLNWARKSSSVSSAWRTRLQRLHFFAGDGFAFSIREYVTRAQDARGEAIGMNGPGVRVFADSTNFIGTPVTLRPRAVPPRVAIELWG